MNVKGKVTPVLMALVMVWPFLVSAQESTNECERQSDTRFDGISDGMALFGISTGIAG
jgi:hypothetical protein